MSRLGLLLQSRIVLSNYVWRSSLLHESNAKVNLQFQRSTSFFNKLTAEQLWKGVVSVSNAGKKRGRGKGQDKKGVKNLNINQKLGFGKENIIWPGLTAPVIQSNTLMHIQRLPPEEKPSVDKPPQTRKMQSTHPLERGWSGKSICGKNIGPPEPQDDVTYDDFQCVVVSNRTLLGMTPLFGRKRKFSSIVLTGNGKGLIGMGKSKALEAKLSIRLAKNKAIKRLISFNFENDYSVNHDFFCQFDRTQIFVYKKPAGYGLKCHRVIEVCCKLIGIKNLAAKVERGKQNVLHIIKAFLIGLMQQKTSQQIVDEKKLHLVEFKDDRYYYPNVLASPKECLTSREGLEVDDDYENYIWGGRTIQRKIHDPSKLFKQPGWEKHLKKVAYKKNSDETKINLRAEYGDLCSHLAEIYPECTSSSKKEKKSEES